MTFSRCWACQRIQEMWSLASNMNFGNAHLARCYSKRFRDKTHNF